MEVKRYHFETIDSTNTWAKSHASTFSPAEVTLITADEQLAGRGRFNRRWVSPPNQNLYATFCFFIDPARIDVGNIPQILALATAEALKELNFHPQLKWPNDILLSQKKVGGILCETIPMEDNRCIVLGMGLNVNMLQEEVAEIDRPATSLAIEGKRLFDLEAVLKLLQNFFLKELDLFLSKGFQPFHARFEEMLWLPKNKELCFHENEQLVRGTFHGIAEDGTLLLRLSTGEIRSFISGELNF